MAIRYPLRRPDLQTKLLPDGHAVIFHDETKFAHVLNPLGSMIWEFCDGERSRDEIVQEVASLAGPASEGGTLEKAGAFLIELEDNSLIIEGKEARE